MGLDSNLDAALAHHLRSVRTPATPPVPKHHIDRPTFFADMKALELRLAIIDDRFERLACRPDEVYQDWRRDTVTKIRALAVRARMLEEAHDLERHHRDRVAALLLTLKHRVGALDARHAAFGDRRLRRGGVGKELPAGSRRGFISEERRSAKGGE